MSWLNRLTTRAIFTTCSGPGARLVAAGTVIGLGAGTPLTRCISGLLFRVSAGPERIRYATATWAVRYHSIVFFRPSSNDTMGW